MKKWQGTEPLKGEVKQRPKPKPGGLIGFILKHHVHPMTVHVPNGVVPLVVILIILAVFSDLAGMAHAAFLCLGFVVLSLPVVWISGLIEWKKKYRGSLTKIFKQKFISAAITTVCAVALLIWHILDPHSIEPGSAMRWPILILNFIMLGATISAGFVGGKLVFKD